MRSTLANERQRRRVRTALSLEALKHRKSMMKLLEGDGMQNAVNNLWNSGIEPARSGLSPWEERGHNCSLAISKLYVPRLAWPMIPMLDSKLSSHRTSYGALHDKNAI